MSTVQTAAPFTGAREQLAGELEWLELVLRERVATAASRRTATERFDEFAGLYVSADEIARYTRSAEQAPEDDTAVQLRTQADLLRRELDARADATTSVGRELRLQRLVRRFALRAIDMRVLLCCLAPDIELRFQRYFAYLQNDVTRRRPTVQLLAELCADIDTAHVRDALSPGAPLVRGRLLSLAGAELPFPARSPVVSDVIVDYIAGTDRIDAQLEGVVTMRAPTSVWPASAWYDRHREIAARLLAPLRRTRRLPTAYIAAPDGCGRNLITDAVAAAAGVRVLRVDCRAWLAADAATRSAMQLLRRDAHLHGCLVELVHAEVLTEHTATAACAAIDEFVRQNDGAGIVLTGSAPVEAVTAALTVTLWGFEIPRPGLAERAELWGDALAAHGCQPEPELIDRLATAFRFTPREIESALERHAAASAHDDSAGVEATLLRQCRETARHTIHRFARKLVPQRGWDDLVVPADSRAQLEEICAAARGRRRVYHEWGFERKLALGAGLNVLFAGPSGVGKTMSAEIVAGELGLDLFAIDLSCIVSKYIGETEKNLSAVFDEAESTNAVLFFDECDALFGKRTEIRDAHDRYANIEVNYLLQRIDQYEGIVILATNLRSNLDGAFTRRIRYAVEFPFPESDQREQIWRKVFPQQAPVATDVDFAFLARQFKLTGGSIRNIALNAAFLAASNGGCVGMKHVIHAARRELQKMGKSPTKADFGRYFSWVREGSAE